jgi:hypothetical protein
MTWEPEDLRRLAGVFPRRPSASLNDNLVDIGLLQELAGYGIEANAPERATTQAIDMSPADMEHAAHSGHLADDLYHPDRGHDLDDHDITIDQTNLDRYGGAVHIYAIRVVMTRVEGKGRLGRSSRLGGARAE